MERRIHMGTNKSVSFFRQENFILPLFFFLGLFLGFLLRRSCFASREQIEELMRFSDAAGSLEKIPVVFIQTLLLYLRAPTLCLLLSAGDWGKVCIPLLLTLHGLVLSLCVFSLSAWGGSGFLLALLCFGVRIPVTGAIALYIAQWRWNMLRRSSGRKQPFLPPVGSLLLCFGISCAGAALEVGLAARFLPVIIHQI